MPHHLGKELGFATMPPCAATGDMLPQWQPPVYARPHLPEARLGGAARLCIAADMLACIKMRRVGAGPCHQISSQRVVLTQYLCFLLLC